MTLTSATQRKKVSDLIKDDLCSTFGIGWPQFLPLVNGAVDELNAVSVHKLKAHSHWRKIFNGETGTDDIDWWIEMETIANHLIKIQRSKSSNISYSKKADDTQKNISSIKPIRYSVSKFQDTILPLLYKHAYNLRLKVLFKAKYDWNQCLEAFNSDDIDVALHNFPTVLAYIKELEADSNMFFFPFFTFYGYAIFVRKSSIEKFAKELNCSKNFADWKNADKKKFLETSKILLERKTDVEWVLKKYCDKFQCNWKIVEDHIIDCDINSGKREFKRKSSVAIYCTNSIHIADLKKQSNKYEAIAKGKELTHHQNYNGIICTSDFFQRNHAKIRILIEIWFKSIEHFKEDWNVIVGTEDEDGFINFHINALLDKLNSHTGSKISIDELIESYRQYNHFFSSAEEAFNSFMENVLEDLDALKNNFEISTIQSKSVGNEIDTELIEKIKQQMIAAKKQLNL